LAREVERPQNLAVSKLTGFSNRLGARGKRWNGKPTGPWIAARKTIQYAALVAFVALFVGSRSGGWAANLANLPMRLDPLVMLAHLLSSRTFLLGSALSLVSLLLTLIAGRAWCGWLCPLGTVLDLFSPRRQREKPSPPPEAWRAIKYGLLLTTLLAALFGNLTLLILDPLTLFFRTLTVSVWPAIDQIATLAETTLYRVSFLAEPISTFDTWLRPGLLPTEPAHYRDALLFAAVFVGVIALNFVAPRFWCRYLCPLGGLLGLLSKVTLLRREVAKECKGCTLCTTVCPTGTVNPARGYASDPGECTLCLDCLEVCPRGSITFTPGFSPAAWQAYDPGRREFLTAFGATIAAIALFRSDWAARRESPHLLRPPGARENHLLEKCIRCGECVRACPTTALQPALTEAGAEGLWTPFLLARAGYCDYACNACGQICPVQAIPPLSLEEKRTRVIGKAYIDQNRCIAWADHRDCIVCEEMCPIPDKAIRLEPTGATRAVGARASVQLPHVIRERCIGCGICEYKCPVNGEAAIRVYVPDAEASI
jgi:polyferredoxin